MTEIEQHLTAARDQIDAALTLLRDGPSPVVTPPPGIDATGATDVTEPLTAWLDSLPDGATADLAGGTYRCETPVKLDDKRGLTIRNGSLIRTDTATHGGIVYPKPNPHLWLMRPVRCRIENVHVVGTNTVSDTPSKPLSGAYNRDYEFEAAIRLERFTDCEVIGGSAASVWGDGVQAQIGDGLLVEEFDVLSNGRQGVSTLGSHITIRRCHITSRRSGIDPEPDTNAQSFGHLLVEDCTIWSWLIAITSGGPGEFSDVEIRHNLISGSGVPCLNVQSSSGGKRDRWNVHHNQFGTSAALLSSPREAINFYNSADSVFENNQVWISPRQSRRAVMVSNGTAGLQVLRNHLVNAATDVIDADGTCNWTAEDNTFGAEPPAGFEPIGPRRADRSAVVRDN